MTRINQCSCRYTCFQDLWFSSVIQSCPTLCDPMDSSMPGLPVHHQHFWFMVLVNINTWTFFGGSDGKEFACNAEDLGSIPGLGRFRGVGNGNSLQNSCLENPTDREAWWVIVHGVAKSQTRLSDYAINHQAKDIVTQPCTRGHWNLGSKWKWLSNKRRR